MAAAEGPVEAFIMSAGNVSPQETEATLRLAVQAKNTGATRLTLCLASRGGDFRQGVSLGNLLRGLPMTFATFNVGVASSAAVVLFLAGEERYAEPNAVFGLHPSSIQLEGSFNPKDLATHRAGLLADDGLEEEMIGGLAGLPNATVRKLVQGSKKLTAQEALELGFVKEVKPLAIPPTALVFST